MTTLATTNHSALQAEVSVSQNDSCIQPVPRKTSRETDTLRKIDMSMLDSCVGNNLRRAAARQRERFNSVFSKYDIRPVQLMALALILRNPGIRQTPLGKALDMKRANVVTLLDELQARELIERRPAPNDRRSYELHLTGNGRLLTEKLLKLHAKLEQDLVDSLGRRQLDTLLALLAQFRGVSSAPDIE